MSRSRGRRGSATAQVVQGEVQRQDARSGTFKDVGIGISLGDLSGPSERGPLVASFTYFGEQIRVHPDVTEVDMIDFLDDAETVDKDDPKSMLMVKNAARNHVHPDDFEKFWQLRKANRQGVEQLMGTIWQIVGGLTGKANGQRSASSDGPPATNPSSPVSSSPPDDAPLVPVADPLREKYLRQIERFEAQGAGGVAMAAQIAVAAEARGVNVERVGVLSSASTA